MGSKLKPKGGYRIRRAETCSKSDSQTKESPFHNYSYSISVPSLNTINGHLLPGRCTSHVGTSRLHWGPDLSVGTGNDRPTGTCPVKNTGSIPYSYLTTVGGRSTDTPNFPPSHPLHERPLAPTRDPGADTEGPGRATTDPALTHRVGEVRV